MEIKIFNFKKKDIQSRMIIVSNNDSTRISFNSRLQEAWKRFSFLIPTNYKACVAYPTTTLLHLIFDRSGAEIALSFHSLPSPLPSFIILAQENPGIRL